MDELEIIARPKYSYTPLSNPNAIRLLQLELHSEPISCQLFEANTPSEFAYHALSYTWGDPSIARPSLVSNNPIVCNGYELQVTKNLYDALAQLRTGNHERSLIWVDAICIDQESVEERNAQVAMMGEIYATATKVVIWLGPDDESTADAAQLVHSFGSVLLRTTIDRTFRPPIDDPKFYESVGHEPLTETQWRKVASLFTRSWFTRGWIIQEYVVAQDRVMLCGPVQINIPQIARLANFLGSTRWINQGVWLKGLKHSRVGIHLLGRMENIANERLSTEDLGSQSSKTVPYAYRLLKELLIMAPRVQYTDNRDRVLAPLAFASRYLPPTHAEDDGYEWLPPDYNESTEQIYADVTRLIIRATNSLSLLLRMESSCVREGFPTWVPDYGSKSSEPVSRTYPLNRGFKPLKQWTSRPEMSSLIPSAQLSYAKLELPVRVIFFDNILDRTQAIALNEEVPPDFFFIANASPASSPFTDEARVEVIWRTMISNRTDKIYRQNEPTEPLGNIFYEFMMGYVAKQLQEYSTDESPIEAAFALLFGGQSTLDIKERMLEVSSSGQIVHNGINTTTLARFRDTLQNACLGRGLANTELGTMALVPNETQLGDFICFVAGSHLPLVLRSGSKEGKYMLVGPAYVHGVMDGELDLEGMVAVDAVLE